MNQFYVFKSPLDELRLQLRWALDNVREPGWNFERINPYTIFWFVLSGSRKLNHDGQIFVLHPGDLVVFSPRAKIRATAPDNEKYPFRYLALGCEAKLQTVDLVQAYRLPFLTRLGEEPACDRLRCIWLKLIDGLSSQLNRTPSSAKRYLGRSEQHPTMMSDSDTRSTIDYISLHSLLYEWFEVLLSALAPLLPPSPVPLDPRVHKVCEYIRSNLGEELQLRALANHVLLSESHLRLLFRKQLQIAPMEYVRQMRLQKARELLLSTTQPIGVISALVGFAEQSQFSSAFRQEEGISPQAYRKEHLGL